MSRPNFEKLWGLPGVTFRPHGPLPSIRCAGSWEIVGDRFFFTQRREPTDFVARSAAWEESAASPLHVRRFGKRALPIHCTPGELRRFGKRVPQIHCALRELGRECCKQTLHVLRCGIRAKQPQCTFCELVWERRTSSARSAFWEESAAGPLRTRRHGRRAPMD